MSMKRFFKRRIVFAGIAALVLTGLAAILAEFLTRYVPGELDVMNRLKPPNLQHLLGTDQLGRDVWTQLLFGARTSLMVGLATMVLSTLLGTVIGITAGYFTALDGPLMRIMDGLMALPDILLAIALMSAFGPSVGNVVLALVITYTPRAARLMRSSVLVTSRREFIEAAKVIGSPSYRIILRHILPNSISPLIVQGTFTFASAVLAEAALSFLGAGVPPEVPTWGIMLSEGRAFMQKAPWITTMPGVAIILVVMGLNITGDALRDFLDPKLKNL